MADADPEDMHKKIYAQDMGVPRGSERPEQGSRVWSCLRRFANRAGTYRRLAPE